MEFSLNNNGFSSVYIDAIKWFKEQLTNENKWKHVGSNQGVKRNKNEINR